MQTTDIKTYAPLRATSRFVALVRSWLELAGVKCIGWYNAFCSKRVRLGWHHREVENWEIQSVVAVSPSGASDSDAAYLLRVGYGGEQTEVVVEFAAPSAVASAGYAEEVARDFLASDEPPQRIVVERDGSVRVADGPLTASRAPRGWSPREPQRARRRGHR